MLRFLASACLLAALTGCAAPRPAPAPPSVAVARPATAERGTILVVRPVPVHAPQPVQVLLRRLGSGDAMLAGTAEFIVRSDAGATLAVVQPADPALRPGQRVSIARGTPTLLDPLPDSVAAR